MIQAIGLFIWVINGFRTFHGSTYYPFYVDRTCNDTSFSISATFPGHRLDAGSEELRLNWQDHSPSSLISVAFFLLLSLLLEL